MPPTSDNLPPAGAWAGLDAATRRQHRRRQRERDSRIEQLAELPIEQMTLAQLSTAIGVHKTTVGRYLRTLGREPRTAAHDFQGQANSLEQRRQQQLGDRERRLEQMRGVTNTRTNREWRELLGVSESTVQDYARSLGERCKPYPEGHRLGGSKGGKKGGQWTTGEKDRRLELIRSLPVAELTIDEVHGEVVERGFHVKRDRVRRDIAEIGVRAKGTSHRARAIQGGRPRVKRGLSGWHNRAIWDVEAATAFREEHTEPGSDAVVVR